MHEFESDTVKTRKIRFSNTTSEELRQIVDALQSLSHVSARRCGQSAYVEVSYDLSEHSCEELEQFLAQKGFFPDHTLGESVKRGLIHYTEEVERENRHMTNRDERYRQIFVSANGRHFRQVERENPLPPEDLRGYF